LMIQTCEREVKRSKRNCAARLCMVIR